VLRYGTFLFFLFPALELWVLIRVGGRIGALATVGLVVLSTMAGLSLLRLRGARILARFQEGAAQGRIPPNPVFDTLCLMAAGWLFVFPGFVSDLIALALLFPVTRQALVALLRRLMLARGFQAAVHTQEARHDGEGHVTWTCATVRDPSGGDARGRQVVIDCEARDVSAAPGDGENKGGPPGSGAAGGRRER
jgi:UPF0716 protein FxsA